MSETLDFYTLYKFGEEYQIRINRVTGDGKEHQDPGIYLRSNDLGEIQFEMAARGLTFLMRLPDDDPSILGTYL